MFTVRWKHVIREAHRQWARRLMMGGALMVYRRPFLSWDDFRVTNWWNKVRSY